MVILFWVDEEMRIKLVFQVVYLDDAHNTLLLDVIYAVKSILINYSDPVQGHQRHPRHNLLQRIRINPVLILQPETQKVILNPQILLLLISLLIIHVYISFFVLNAVCDEELFFFQVQVDHVREVGRKEIVLWSAEIEELWEALDFG